MAAHDIADVMPDARTADWWTRHRDAVTYPLAGAVVASIGLVWPPILSMILTPAWMVLLVWWLPNRIERAVRARS